MENAIKFGAWRAGVVDPTASPQVKIKRSGSTKMTAAQQRLESRLSAAQPRRAKNTGTKRCEQRADKVAAGCGW